MILLYPSHLLLTTVPVHLLLLFSNGYMCCFGSYYYWQSAYLVVLVWVSCCNRAGGRGGIILRTWLCFSLFRKCTHFYTKQTHTLNSNSSNIYHFWQNPLRGTAVTEHSGFSSVLLIKQGGVGGRQRGISEEYDCAESSRSCLFVYSSDYRINPYHESKLDPADSGWSLHSWPTLLH